MEQLKILGKEKNVKLIFQNLTEVAEERNGLYSVRRNIMKNVWVKNIQASLHQKDLDCQQLQSRLSASETSLQRGTGRTRWKGRAAQSSKKNCQKWKPSTNILRQSLNSYNNREKKRISMGYNCKVKSIK